MPHNQPAKERLTIFLPPEVKAAIVEQAGVAGQTLSNWVERAVRRRMVEKKEPTQ